MPKIIATVSPYYSQAHQQLARFRLLSGLEIEQPDRSATPLQDLTLRLHANPQVFEPYSWHIDALGAGAVQELRDRQPDISLEYLEGVIDETQVELRFSLDHEGSEIASAQANTLLLPKDHWAGSLGNPEMLACFVMPNSDLVEKLVKRAAQALADIPGGYAMNGYQSRSREAPWMMAQALWQAVAELGLDYVSPPPDFAESGQRIRLPERIEATGMAACLDTSTLFAACLEHIGLHPVIVLTRDHACAGCWLLEESFQVPSNDDPMDMRKRVDAQDIALFETTGVLRQPIPSFAEACDMARALLNEEVERDFVLALDISQARKRAIRPLPSRRESMEEKARSATGPVRIPKMEAPPPMPLIRPEDGAVENTPEGRVDNWQRRLLDLSKRNRLLNFGGRASHIRLRCPDIARLEDALAGEKKFEFVSMQESGFDDLEGGSSPSNPDFDRFALEQLDDRRLVAEGARDKLDNTLLALYRKAKNDLEEGGSNTLFMSIGMLRWQETEKSKKSYKAPLVMLPMQLHRRSARSKITAAIHPDEEAVFNSTLIEFLLQDYEIDLGCYRESLPTDEHGVDIPRVWERVREAIKDIKGFELIEDIVVGNFSFRKFLMWQDLHDRLDALKNNLFVNHLIEQGGGGGYPHTASFIDAGEVDRRIEPGSLHTPLYADSSQLAAIEASTREQDYVLEGPPGTGKSETIANIIATNIAKGRKVLFVAEKMEALNVVYRRLEKVGLGHRCLELHSNKANKKAVLKQFADAWHHETAPPKAWDRQNSKLSKQRTSLNRYLEGLHGTSVFCDITPWEAIAASLGNASDGFSLGLSNDPGSIPPATRRWLGELQKHAERLLESFDAVSDIDPSAVEAIGSGEWSHRWDSDFRSAAKALKDDLAAMKKEELALCEALGRKEAIRDNEALKAIESLLRSANLTALKRRLLIFGSDAKRQREALARVIEMIERRRADHARLSIDLDFEQALALPTQEWIESLRSANPIIAFFRKFRIRKQLDGFGIDLTVDLATLRALDDSRSAAANIKALLPPFIRSGVWRGWKETPVDELRELLSDCKAFAADADDLRQRIDDDIESLIERIAEKPEYRQSLAEMREKAERYERSLEAWQSLGATAKFENHRELSEILDRIEEINRLDDCLEWNRLSRKACGDYDPAPIVDGIVKGRLQEENLAKTIHHAFHRWLAPLLIDANSVLRRFRVRDHERLRHDFTATDEAIENACGAQVAADTAAFVPSREGRLSEGLRLLSKEIGKKQRHIPIRKLMEGLGAESLDLTPCMMMSPISIAQFLPRNFNHFDLVVFDEASQITVWDAIGTIARGKNVIVVGDPKQMPPTNFFNRGATDSEDEEEDYESILDRALDAGLKKHRLTGHYRSKHESLIAFSNSKYYENSLATYPSAETKESAVTLHKVEGLYSKGKEANNPKEAQAVADEVLRRLQDPDLSRYSIGVVALNQSQQRTIENRLDEMRRQYPETEEFFQEEDGRLPLFVKNLETVQGDERDVIILSLGYGPTEPGARTMSMNFGPLNRQGGERRLNVAITRAKYEVLVFASMDYTMLDLTRTQAQAVADMRDYLEYAERGICALAGQSRERYGIDHFDSEFERSVAMALRSRGWKVISQVGVSRFRVDLGVVHPDRPGKYLAGVECDGATYHSAPSARDRDRIRQQVLESLGWRFARIWSTDYFRDPDEVIEDIDRQLHTLVEKDRTGQASDQDR
ncbi:MAG: DUF4011 domain-containing protein [Ectothiorhodospiraceae bacterium AqS1]|nr:DUF4011 domain-containing protein [Ectothiorhodospiraceae bacterium AqS1]